MKYDGSASDIWSCGIILYALLTGHLPFDDENIRHLLSKVKAGKFYMPTDISAGARDLISRMLTVNPKRRITVSKKINMDFAPTTLVYASNHQIFSSAT